jgi:hypothetical protein
MINDAEAWRRWEEAGPLSEPVDFQKNLRIFDQLYDLACKLGVFPLADPLEGIEIHARVARILNGGRAPGADRTGS